jgi:hypothetical protein
LRQVKFIPAEQRGEHLAGLVVVVDGLFTEDTSWGFRSFVERPCAITPGDATLQASTTRSAPMAMAVRFLALRHAAGDGMTRWLPFFRRTALRYDLVKRVHYLDVSEMSTPGFTALTRTLMLIDDAFDGDRDLRDAVPKMPFDVDVNVAYIFA